MSSSTPPPSPPPAPPLPLPLSWDNLRDFGSAYGNVAETSSVQHNGPPSAQAKLRLFGQPADTPPRVTLYRDNHAWCPYCQKVWLYLELAKIPYAVRKVTMFCYGQKEAWYKRIVPSGMLPAVEIDGRLVTESDVILHELDSKFGALSVRIADKKVQPFRRLERRLFGAWCEWLCRRNRNSTTESRAAAQFSTVISEVESTLQATPGPYFYGGDISVVDCIFIPYVERMSASLYYYKGYTLRDRDARPSLCDWFDALESRHDYRATQSDFHTHAHDLPPQMGGCYFPPPDAAAALDGAKKCAALVDGHGIDGSVTVAASDELSSYDAVPEVGSLRPEPDTARAEAVWRVVKHREPILAKATSMAPFVSTDDVDTALRAALTLLVTENPLPPPSAAAAAESNGGGDDGGGGGVLADGTDVCLRAVRDSISVPRDMSIHAARRLRTALGQMAASVGSNYPPSLPLSNRYDSNPVPFIHD